MIKIGKPFVFDDGEYAYLKAPIQISNDTVEAYMSLQTRFKHVHWRLYENYPPIEWREENAGLWFAVPIRYKEYLCADRGDAFVVALLWYAMVTESDIECEVPVSEKMAFGIRQYLVPALMKEEKGYKRHINLICNTTSAPIANKGLVGTGMSCGVDSIYTLDIFTRSSTPEKYRLSCLTYFNMGAIFHPNRATKKVYSMREFYETTDKMSLEKLKNAQAVADMSNLPLLYVKSNMDSDYYRGAYGDTGVYRNCACVLATAGLFSVYYCSSGGSNAFDLSLDMGSEYYEALLCDVFSTESLTFMLSDYDTRLEKMQVLQHNKAAQKYLDVCFCFNSCGECSKCLRTLVTLDILGTVGEFKEVFNVDKYKKDRINAFVWLLKTKDIPGDDGIHAKLVYDYAMLQGFQIPQEAIKLYKRQKRISHYKSIIKKIIGRQ